MSEEEVIEVLDKPGEDRPGHEGSRTALGQTASGRYLRVIYVPDPERDSVFVVTAYELSGKPAGGFSQAQKEEAAMSENRFPAGWDEDRVRRVLAHYEGQPEDDALSEDEAGVAPSETVMSVPVDLVPAVRELIAKHQR